MTPGSFINMIAGPIAMSAPIQISAAWFPPQVHSSIFSSYCNFFKGENQGNFHRSDVQCSWGEDPC